MKITIVAVGKIKEKFFSMAIDEYLKRLSRYCKLDIVEVPDEKTSEDATQREMRLIKEKEGERILASVMEGSYVIALYSCVKMLDSVQVS